LNARFVSLYPSIHPSILPHTHTHTHTPVSIGRAALSLSLFPLSLVCPCAQTAAGEGQKRPQRLPNTSGLVSASIRPRQHTSTIHKHTTFHLEGGTWKVVPQNGCICDVLLWNRRGLCCFQRGKSNHDVLCVSVVSKPAVVSRCGVVLCVRPYSCARACY